MVSCDVEKLGEPLYHQLRASIVYEPREQGMATEGVEEEVRREGEGRNDRSRGYRNSRGRSYGVFPRLAGKSDGGQ
jgi:hypothetical protein